MRKSDSRNQLSSLARLNGLQTSFFNVLGQRVQANNETLVSLLGLLGVDASTSEACRESLFTSSRRYWERIIEPIVIAWDGLMPRLEVRMKATEAYTPRIEIYTESGETKAFRAWEINIDADPGSEVDGAEFRRMRVNTGERLPWGYHTLRVSLGSRSNQATIISAPRRCFAEATKADDKQWGLFAPLYALRGPSDVGSGGYRELRDLLEWTESLGGSFAGTLPLLPIDVDGSSPSPYLPETRLFWSDFYIDLTSIPFMDLSPGAKSAAESAARGLSEVSIRLVDYREVLSRKTSVLTTLWKDLRTDSSEVMAALEEYLRANPSVTDFARYRVEREAANGSAPSNHITVDSREPACAGRDVGYYEFLQWLADTQMTDCAQRNARLYLDLPVGVHPAGYDVQRYRECFMLGASCGAPPDSVFTTGQNWGAPPLNPETMRADGYAYVRACLAHHMQHARVLRIDHVMGLHRMFCIPAGMKAGSGTYVRYRSEELYALLSLESQRHETTVVGEDLGTVPREVPKAMRRHGVNRMFVLYYEMDRIAAGDIPRVPREAMASLNTHDMPTMAATWAGIDILQQIELGILAPEKEADYAARRESAKKHLLTLLELAQRTDEDNATNVVPSIIAWLGRSQARFVMISIDDLILGMEQPNVPGIDEGRRNWRYRLQCTLPQLQNDASVAAVLRALNEARRGPAAQRKAAR